MAARGRRVNRVTIHTLSGTPVFRMGIVEAERLKDAGELHYNTFTERWTRTQLQRKSPLSPANLTSADMHGVVERRRRALERVANWPVEHDRRAVTVIAGRGIWIPDADTVELRSKLQEQASRAKRYANAARN
jgi:hypothetical protein